MSSEPGLPERSSDFTARCSAFSCGRKLDPEVAPGEPLEERRYFRLIYGFSREGMDMVAHLGGLAGGFVCGLILSQANVMLRETLELVKDPDAPAKSR